MALSLDPSSEQLRVEGLLEKAGWPGLRGRLPEQSLRILNALEGFLSDSDRPMVSPTTYMFDGSGRLVALYRGPLDEVQVEADFGLATELDPVLRRGFAGLRPGRWVQAPVKEGWAGFISVLKLRGLGDAAKELEALAIEVQDLDSPGALVEMARARWLQGQREAARQLMVDALSLDGQSGSPSGMRIEWLRSLASMETILGHDQRALNLWDQLLEATPEDYGVWVGRGLVLHRMGNVVDYDQLLGELTEKAPEFALQLLDLVEKGDR
jgi:tetratricopeptide (TPR) repeat protein